MWGTQLFSGNKSFNLIFKATQFNEISSKSLNLKYEAIEFNEIVDNDLLNLFPVNISAILTNKIQILHEYEHLYFEFALILNKWVFNDNTSFYRCIFYFMLLILFVCIIYRADRCIV